MTRKRGVKFVRSRLIMIVATAAAFAVVPSAGMAQRQAPSPEQRLDRLEQQVQQVQRQLFPKGRPADTAGFSDEPAATRSSVLTLDQRLDALERQAADVLRQSEENGNRLRGIEDSVARIRAEYEQRLATLEQRMSNPAMAPSAAVPQAAPPSAAATLKPRPQPQSSNRPIPNEPPTATSDTTATGAASDPGEDAYTEGFRLWQAGQYDQSITALRAFTSAYPKHRRVSWANNLVGRALLDSGQPRAAAAALLANYRNNPEGERAGDSLYYLGQALIKLGQPGQACKVYGEFDAVYGVAARADLKKLEADAKSQAQCK